MAALAPSNVVNLTEFDRLRRGTPRADSVRLLSDCRDLALRNLVESFADLRSRLDEDLFQLADDSVERDAQNLYLEARGKMNAGWPAFEKAFRRSFIDAVDRTLRSDAGVARPELTRDTLELSLVDDDDLAERIALGEAAVALKSAAEEQFYALARRVALLLDRDELEDSDNPFAPERVCEALAGACHSVIDTPRARLALLKQTTRRVAPVLDEAYRAVNRHLQNAGILPELRRGHRRPVKNHTHAPAAGSLQSAEDMLARLRQLVQLQENLGPFGADTARGSESVSSAPAAGLAVVDGGAPSPAARATAFLTSLTQLQRGQVPSALPEGVIAWEIASPVDGSINVLRELRSNGLASFGGQVDSITIDIVATLFDFVLGDEKIPDAIKALVGRLQIPVLKVALLDHAFFSSKSHPARRLLDSVSRAALGWSQEVDQGDPLYSKIAGIVARIQSDFDRDVQIFADLQQELEVFLAERDAEEQDFIGRSTERLEQREQEEIGWILAGERIKERIGPDMPASLAEFLLGHWQRVLKTTYVRFGEDSEPWRHDLDTLDDLVWSVAPKAGADERRRLVALLPDLLRRVHQGLDSIALPHAERASFFDALVELHSAAVKAGLLANPSFSPASPSVWQEKAMAVAASEAPGQDVDSVAAQGELLVTRVADDDMEIEEVILVGGPRSGETTGDVFDERVSNLRRGDWVEFRQEEAQPVRRRLSWISPRRGVFLFTAYPAANAVSISPEALAHQFRIGSADLVHDEPLFDRAVNGMLDALQVRVQ